MRQVAALGTRLGFDLGWRSCCVLLVAPAVRFCAEVVNAVVARSAGAGRLALTAQSAGRGRDGALGGQVADRADRSSEALFGVGPRANQVEHEHRQAEEEQGQENGPAVAAAAGRFDGVSDGGSLGVSADARCHLNSMPRTAWLADARVTLFIGRR